MNRLAKLFLGIILLINFGCQKEIKKTSPISQQKNKKNLIVIKPDYQVRSIESIGDIADKNENFEKLIKSFQSASYTLDELVELTGKDIKYVQQLHNKAFKGKIDTAAVNGRLVLTEVILKKLNFLLKKEKPQTDTIKKTLNALINNLNSVINQIELYGKSYDEFEHILKYDSIEKSNNDRSGSKLNKLSDKPVIRRNNKIQDLKLPKELIIKRPK
jgi:hypothetical protein